MVHAESPDTSRLFGLTLKWKRELDEYGLLCERDGRDATETALARYELATRVAKLELEATRDQE